MSWKRFLRRRFWDEERARELDSYLEFEIADNLARGMPPEEARRAAQRKLGNAASVREEIYRMNTLGFIETFWQDVRFGSRVLWKSPGLTAVALLSLSLGIGATTAIFSVVYGVLISPYPYAKANQIWAPEIRNARNPKQSRGNYRIAEYLQVRTLPAFSEMMATSPENRLLTGTAAPENFTSVSLTGNGFQFLGVDPVLGRTILPSDIKSNGEPEPVIVLSYRAWQRLFQGSPDALGKTVTLNDTPYSVIGVMPPRFGWWTSDGGWLALRLDPRQERPIFPIARLRAGVTPSVAEQQLHAIHMRTRQGPSRGFSERRIHHGSAQLHGHHRGIGRDGVQPAAPRRRRRLSPVDRVRQCGQSPDGTRHLQAPRDRAPHVGGRGTGARAAPVAHRKRDALAGWRSPGDSARSRSHQGHRAAHAGFLCAQRSAHRRERLRARVLRRSLRAHRHPLRTRARARMFAPAAGGDAEGRDQGLRHERRRRADREISS